MRRAGTCRDAGGRLVASVREAGGVCLAPDARAEGSEGSETRARAGTPRLAWKTGRTRLWSQVRRRPRLAVPVLPPQPVQPTSLHWRRLTTHPSPASGSPGRQGPCSFGLGTPVTSTAPTACPAPGGWWMEQTLLAGVSSGADLMPLGPPRGWADP